MEEALPRNPEHWIVRHLQSRRTSLGCSSLSVTRPLPRRRDSVVSSTRLLHRILVNPAEYLLKIANSITENSPRAINAVARPARALSLFPFSYFIFTCSICISLSQFCPPPGSPSRVVTVIPSPSISPFTFASFRASFGFVVISVIVLLLALPLLSRSSLRTLSRLTQQRSE